jgi:hypothetical protein
MSLEALTTEALAAIAAAQDLATLDQVRVQFTGKKASLQNNLKHWVKWTLKNVKFKLQFMLFVKQSIQL